MDSTALAGGFARPAFDAAHAFRAAMQAMARPGTIHEVTGAAAPSPVSPAASVLLAMLADQTTGVHLAGACDAPAVRDWITFHTSAPLVASAEADFVLGGWDAVDLNTLRIGTPEYPDRSATVIVELPALEAKGATLTGPGIKETAQLSLPELGAFQRNRVLFPLGLDFYFTCGSRLAALPRSTEVR